jgi:hypothetical protein
MRRGIGFSSGTIQFRICPTFLCCAGFSFLSLLLPQFASSQDTLQKPNPLEQLATEVSNPRSFRRLQGGGSGEFVRLKTALKREIAGGVTALKSEKETLRVAKLQRQELPSDFVRARERRKSDVIKRYQRRIDSAQLDLDRADELHTRCFPATSSISARPIADSECQKFMRRLADGADAVQTERHSMTLELRAIEQERPTQLPRATPRPRVRAPESLKSARNPYNGSEEAWW